MDEKKETQPRKENKEGILISRNMKQRMCSKIKPQKNYYPHIPQNALEKDEGNISPSLIFHCSLLKPHFQCKL